MWESPDWRFVIPCIAVMAVTQAIGPDYFRYQQDLVAGGQVWRLLSAHWVHVGWAHFALNCVGLIICVTLTQPRWSPIRWLLCSLLLGCGISLLLAIHNPELRDYAGLSGVLFGLYLLAALQLFPRDRLVAVLIVAAVVGKVLLEQFTNYGFDSGELIGARVIVDAHLYGVLTVIATALAWATYTMNQRPETQSN